MNVVKLIAV